MRHTKIRHTTFLGSRLLCRFFRQLECFDCSAYRSARLQVRWRRPFADSRARRNFRAAGYQAAANEIIHIRESAAEVRSTRRELSIPLMVVTGARGADETWRHLQRDQVGLSRRGCQIIADQSGHVVPLEQPSVVVEAIRAIVDTARERTDVAPCARLGAG